VDKMAYVDVRTPDHIEVFERVRSGKELTRPQLDKILQNAGGLIEGTMKQLTPIGKTGLTSASIETRKEAELTYGIGSYSRGHILRFLDRGTGIYRRGQHIVITPTAKRALRFISKETGDEVFAAYCVIKGIIPMEILTRSVQAHLETIDQMMKEEIKI